MNNLSQLGQQLVALWKHLGINQRISIVLAAGVVVLGLGGIAYFSSHPDYALLYGKLEESEAAKVAAALSEANVPYKIRGSGTIYVPADKVYQMRMQLASKGIPRNGDGVGFEIFDKPNFGISDFVQRANYLRAVQGELARTISEVDSIEAARVMVVMPENRLLTDTKKHPTASVFVRVRGNSPLPAQTVNAIRFLVANSVEGLQPNFVSVVDNSGNVLSENNDDDSLVGMTTTQFNARKNLEAYLAKKAESMLDTVLGAGQSVVRVSTELNFDTMTRTEEKFDPDAQVIRTSMVNDENTDSTTAVSNGGAPGAQSNADNTNNVASTPVNSNRIHKKITNNQYEINKTTSSQIQAAGAVKRISASVFIAANYEGTGKDRKTVPRSKEELEKLRRIVQGAIGVQEGVDSERKDTITLEEMTFNDQPAIEIAQQFEKVEKQQFWVNLLRQAIYPVAALAMLFVFWRSFKRTPADKIPIGVPLGKFSTNGHSNGNGSHRESTVVTVDVFNQLIRENPNNMTQAIRTWMTRGTTPKS